MTLESQLPYKTHKLSNGIRLVHRSTYSPVSHTALTINAGSRDEMAKENGIAHFIEHIIFKGTTKRNNFDILNRIDGVGGELNAFTSKEETCIYASYLDKYSERVLELLSDIIFNSRFPEKEIEKEKIVILDEINSYNDSPSELIFDDFEKLVYRNHGLGRYVLGTPSKVRAFTKEDIRNFINRTYSTENIVISTIGSIDFEKWVRLCEKHFSHIEHRPVQHKRTAFRNYKPTQKEFDKNTNQTHAIIGNIAFSYNDKNRIPFSLLSNIIGGPAMNSKLNLRIRERYGYTYALESHYTAFSDTGLFTIYAATDKRFIDKTIELIEKELEGFATKPLSKTELSRAKQQLIGQLAIQYESNQNEVISMGKSMLSFNQVESLTATNNRIKQVEASQIQEVAKTVFNKEMYSLIKYK